MNPFRSRFGEIHGEAGVPWLPCGFLLLQVESEEVV